MGLAARLGRGSALQGAVFVAQRAQHVHCRCLQREVAATYTLRRTQGPTTWLLLQVCAAGALLAILGREGRLGGGGGGSGSEGGIMVVNGISEVSALNFPSFLCSSWRPAQNVRVVHNRPACECCLPSPLLAERAASALPGSPGEAQVALLCFLPDRIRQPPQVSLDGYLTVDPASLAALQIFQEEAHPAAAMGIGAAAGLGCL